MWHSPIEFLKVIKVKLNEINPLCIVISVVSMLICAHNGREHFFMDVIDWTSFYFFFYYKSVYFYKICVAYYIFINFPNFSGNSNSKAIRPSQKKCRYEYRSKISIKSKMGGYLGSVAPILSGLKELLLKVWPDKTLKRRHTKGRKDTRLSFNSTHTPQLRVKISVQTLSSEIQKQSLIQ